MEDVHEVDDSRVHWEDVVGDRSFRACRQQRRAADEGATDMVSGVRRWNRVS